MLKKTTSLTLTFSGIIMLVTSIVLYVGPASHVGHFCPWSFMGLTRHHWGALHLNSGLLFCIAMILHVFLNGRLLMAYIRRVKRGYPALLFSLAVTLYVCVGGYFEITPMKQVLNLARVSRMASIQRYGSPPYGAASAYPVRTIARYMGWNPATVMERLASNHVAVISPDQSLTDVATSNQLLIGQVLDIMCPEGGR